MDRTVFSHLRLPATRFRSEPGARSQTTNSKNSPFRFISLERPKTLALGPKLRDGSLRLRYNGRFAVGSDPYEGERQDHCYRRMGPLSRPFVRSGQWSQTTAGMFQPADRLNASQQLWPTPLL